MIGYTCPIAAPEVPSNCPYTPCSIALTPMVMEVMDLMAYVGCYEEDPHLGEVTLPHMRSGHWDVGQAGSQSCGVT